MKITDYSDDLYLKCNIVVGTLQSSAHDKLDLIRANNVGKVNEAVTVGVIQRIFNSVQLLESHTQTVKRWRCTL